MNPEQEPALRGDIQRTALERSLLFLLAFAFLLACGGQDASVKDGTEHPDGVTFAQCSNGEIDEGEGDIDCGGVCAPCADGQSCALDDQCASGSCDSLGVCLHPSCSNSRQDATEDGLDCGGVCLACLGAACTEDRGCKSTYCEDGVCMKPACDDGVQNGDETGVDCGGGCPQCAEGQRCETDADCLSYYCREGRCDQPTCSDGVTNGFESDVDCGGDCKGCPLGAACDVPSDCVDGNCIDGVCVSMPETCTDGELNGDETDLDCGGPCWPCIFGQHCVVHDDCVTEACEQGLCAAPESCRDAVKSGYETDVDCGGEYCSPCALEKYCLVHADCLSLTCLYGICAVPACDDLILNGGESDVDCGGHCAPCGDGDACNEWEDCASFRCAEGLCVSCADGEANGEETALDCGGPCAPCVDGLSCLVDEDCASARCAAEVCVSCADGAANGGESDVDCGGPCAGCADGLICAGDGDCQSDHCEDGGCVSCADGAVNGSESDVDCGGGGCAPCADGMGCVVDADCASARCEDGTCTGCGDDLKNGDETDVDCGGACPPCGGGKSCLIGDDCTTGVCLPDLTCCVPNACGACGDVPDEVCDGIDNDCDGDTDEVADIAAPTPCLLQDGVCAGAMTACHGVDGWGCRPEDYLAHDAAWEAEEEVCDLLDNDCDGQTDEPDFCAVCSEAATPQPLFQPGSGEAWLVSYQFLALLGGAPAVVMARDAGSAPAEALLSVDGGLEVIEGAANGAPTIAALGDDLHIGMIATPSNPLRSWVYTRHADGSVSASEIYSAKKTDLGAVPVAAIDELRAVLYASTSGNATAALLAEGESEWDTNFIGTPPPDPAAGLAALFTADGAHAHLVYRADGTGGVLKHVRIGKLPTTLAPQAGPPDMASSGDGLRLVYEDASGDVVHRAYAGAWSGANAVGEGALPAVTVLSDGNSVVARVTPDDQIKLSVQDGAFAWEELATITPALGAEQSITRLNIEAHESDIVHVAWVRAKLDGSDLVIEHQVHCPGIP